METSSFTNSTGLKIFTRYWPVEDNPKAVVIIVHGIGEHSGRYLHVAEALNAAGYICYSFDHHGHGQSEGERVKVESFTTFRDDLKQYYDIVKQKHSADKIFILGHSMGSLISLQFVLAYPDTLTGLVLSGTDTHVASIIPPILRSIINFLYKFLPHLPVSAPIDPEALTSDPEMMQKLLDDDLLYTGWLSVSASKFNLDGDKMHERAHEITLPILIMHGEDDVVTPISGSHIMYERVSSEDKTLKTWPEMKHEIMNEIGREEVLATIIEWFNKH